MKKIILLITILILSSCGLFKNTSKDLAINKSSLSAEKRVERDIKEIDKSTLNEVSTGVSREVNFNGYKVKADKVKLNPDGSIEAEGGVSLEGNSSNEKNQKDSTNRQEKNNKELSNKSNESSKEEQRDYHKELHKESTPSIKGMLWFWIGGGIFVVIVGIAIAFWLGFRPKKAK